MAVRTHAAAAAAPRHRVRELVCTYRPLRDAEGHLVRTSTCTLSTPSLAATVLAPLIADQVVEVFGVACLSTRFRLLAWHLVSRGTRTSTQVSLPEVFVPACLTPGTTGLIVVHNHPSGDPTPSSDDMALTRRLQMAGALIDVPLLDHLVIGEGDRYFSFREAGHIDACTSWARMP